MSHATITNCVFSHTGVAGIKAKMLNWAKQFDIFCFIDNHQYNIPPHSVDCMLAAGAVRSFSTQAGTAMEGLRNFLGGGPGWYFGHLGFDLKTETEVVASGLPDRVGFDDIAFFQPEVLIQLVDDRLIIEGRNAEEIHREILEQNPVLLKVPNDLLIRQSTGREEYLDIIENLRRHILRGDCYEINYCVEFFAEQAEIDPFSIYSKLSELSPNPFSALYRKGDQFLVCASPERFICKSGNTLVSQPIKGTAKRIPGDEQLDQKSREHLMQSEKDRAENVMVVDLVRNDLSKLCLAGTVHVDELYGIYSFPQVHQMISTVSGELNPGVDLPDIISACFPMGSMTGAPKKRVLELIEQYERRSRGIFSGALGYVDPNGDFDFNVVIRSIMYNKRSQYLSFQAGSAITFNSNPEEEWEECLLKAEAIKKVLVE